MEAFFVWVKNLIGCLCILELLYHMVQNQEYQKYLRFFGGMVFMILVLQPILEVFRVGDLFENAFYSATIQAEVREIKEAAQALEDLQNDKVQEVYQMELERQMENVVKWHGNKLEEIDIVFTQDADYPGQLHSIELVCEKEDAGWDAIRMELGNLYGLDAGQIQISAKE